MFQRYLNEFNLTNNLKELSIEAIDKINDYPIDKLSRWLGFVQGYIIFTNQSTIDIERDFSRPLFHNAYENENIKIPSSFSSSYKFKGEQNESTNSKIP